MSGLTAGEKFPEGGKLSDNIRWEHEQVKSDTLTSQVQVHCMDHPRP